MRHAIVLVLSLALVAAAAAANPSLPSVPAPITPTAALSAPVYVLSGGGYGHGVGLNQYGAFGQAKANRGYREILGFYYPGTVLGKAPSAKVRVLIVDGRSVAKLASVVPFSVRDGSGVVTSLPAGEIALKPDLTLVVDGMAKALPAPLSFMPGKGGTLTLDGKGYRGELRVTVVQKGLQIIDVVGLDAYLLGVVPGEMPKEWPAAALQAQAVAARSYALASMAKNMSFDLYSDTRSQVYYGVAAESPATTIAVKATRGEILTYGGKVATTFYYSSSGGRTASSEDVFGVVTPYLQARDDPWDALSPYHRWAPRSYTAVSLGQAFGLSAPVVESRSSPRFPAGLPPSRLSRSPVRAYCCGQPTCEPGSGYGRPLSNSASSGSLVPRPPCLRGRRLSFPAWRVMSQDRCSRSLARAVCGFRRSGSFPQTTARSPSP